jgi:uncharacterized membrane protein YedE/YeeE
MENVRPFQAAVFARSLAVAAVAATIVGLSTHAWCPALALVAGVLIGLAYLFHIATGFNRLAKGGKGYLPLLTVESLVRVLVAGAAPFVIVGRGPVLGYALYLAGFVAPLAVALLTFRQQIRTDSVQHNAAS